MVFMSWAFIQAFASFLSFTPTEIPFDLWSQINLKSQPDIQLEQISMEQG